MLRDSEPAASGGSTRKRRSVARRKGPEKVGSVLEGFLERSGLKGAVLRAGAMEEWEQRVGEAVARVTRPRGIRDGTIVVEVRSSAWLMELNLVKSEILNRLNEDREEGRIDDIVFVLSDHS